jgi:hypothetical protein
MSERSALVAVLGALDTVIATTEDGSERQLMQERVAELIPPYGESGAVGWYNRAFRGDAPLPTHAEAEADLTAALRDLASTRDVQVSREPSARMLPNWIVAVGAVVRALPAYRPPAGVTDFDPREHPEAEWATRALMVPGVVAAMPMGQIPTADELAVARAQAIDLLGRLADPDQLPSISEYRRFRENNRMLLHTQILSQPDPCATELVVVGDPVTPDIAVALTTSVCVAGVTLTDAEQTFLKPATWASNDAWCAMEADSQQPRTYLEVVDLDCTGSGSLLRVAVWLEFSELVARGDSRIISYAIADGYENVVSPSGLRANGAVTVDEGSIKVTKELVGGAEHLLIETTKRVTFTNASFDESTIGILACAIGWGAMALDFVSGLLAKLAGPEEVSCVPKDNDTGAAGSAGPASTGGTGKAGVTLGETLDDATALIKQSIDDCATAFKRSFETALGTGTGTAPAPGTGTGAAPAPSAGTGASTEGTGGHTADTLVAEMSGAFARSVQAWARLLTAATSIAAGVASTQPGATATAGTTSGSEAPPEQARGARKTAKKKKP